VADVKVTEINDGAIGGADIELFSVGTYAHFTMYDRWRLRQRIRVITMHQEE
jgi:hypothetical protein